MIVTQHLDGSFTIVGIEFSELEDMYEALWVYVDRCVKWSDASEWIGRFDAINGVLGKR